MLSWCPSLWSAVGWVNTTAEKAHFEMESCSFRLEALRKNHFHRGRVAPHRIPQAVTNVVVQLSKKSSRTVSKVARSRCALRWESFALQDSSDLSRAVKFAIRLVSVSQAVLLKRSEGNLIRAMAKTRSKVRGRESGASIRAARSGGKRVSGSSQSDHLVRLVRPSKTSQP